MTHFALFQSPKHQSDYAKQWAKLNSANMANFKALWLDGVRIGWLDEKTLPLAAAHLDLSEYENAFIWQAPKRFDERSQQLHQAAKSWLEAGIISGWRDECLPIWASLGEELLAKIERSAAHILGVQGYGVHLNAYTYRHGELHLWLSRRSAHKPTSPHKLDQLCAGALSVGHGVWETLYKEAWEEAGIPKALLENRCSVMREMRYQALGAIGVRDDVMLVFDVQLPEDFTPVNHDGEVETFYCVPADEAWQLASGSDFKLNSAVCTLDFLQRQSALFV
ncbi:MAG: DUF4743 domain-containing protein [Cardiobacteriaceae bacterium]|nr:DUF4743 domain-containing protein [Cardiobacteriaceae bacterium]